MRFNFKKIASVLASAVMLGSTAGMALAANYPDPLVVGGAADVGIVVTSGSHAGAVSDWDVAVSLQSALQGLVTSATTTTGSGVSGEAYPLYTSSSKVYFNDSINSVKDIITDSALPTILADGDFSGNVDSDFTQVIDFHTQAYFGFDKIPTSDDDPTLGVILGTTAGNRIYSAQVTFDKAINFSHSDSEGESLTLFGQTFTVGVDTDTDTIVLYKSAQTLDLSVGGDNPNPSETVTIDDEEYTIELTAASDTSATIKVTDSEGNSDTKEINEADSKKIQSLEVAVNIADESTATNTISAEVTVGAQKVKLEDGDEVKLGTDEDAVDNTQIDFGTGNPNNLTTLYINISALNTDEDAILEGGSFVDPVFGTFKIDFAGINVPEDSTARETIDIKYSGDDKATITMTSHTGDTKENFYWYYNDSASVGLADSSGDKINVIEMAMINKSQYAVVGNEDEGYLIEVKRVYNASTGYSNDEVKVRDVFSGSEDTASITAEGTGTITIGGKSYTVTYVDDRSASDDEYIRLNYPDSSGNNAVVYPTIETGKGAKLTFYEPLTITITNWDGSSNTLAGLLFPDGNGYETITVTYAGSAGNALWNITDGGTITQLNTSLGSGADSVKVKIGNGVYYNFTTTGTANQTTLYLLNSDASANVDKPGLLIFAEEDDNNEYEALIVEMEGAGTSSDGVGVSDIEMTWSNQTVSQYKQLESDDDLIKLVDLWGTIVTIDKSESDQYTATISYPDEQIYAQLYISEESAAITAETTSAGGGQVLVVKDTEVESVKDSNLVVVGGSCINSVAAEVLGIDYPTCGSDFTTATNVGAGQYLIKAVASPYNAEKTAVLVAGYEAADTKNAAEKLKEGHATDVDTENIYPVTTA
jgi:hypothetical protein